MTGTYRLINSLICCSARAYAAPFPMTTSGAWAFFRACTTAFIRLVGATACGDAGRRESFSVSMACVFRIISAGKSTKLVPGVPKYALRYASAIKLGMEPGYGGRIAVLACGFIRETWSSSWKAPLLTLCLSEEPASTNNGHLFALEFPI